MYKYFLNPFILYIFIFLIVFILYGFNLSYVQYRVNLESIYFLLFTFILSIFFAFIVLNIKINRDVDLRDTGKNKIIFFVIVSMALNFLYQGYVPFIYTLHGQYYDYFKFGIPSFQALFVPYLTVFGCVTFFNYLGTKSKKSLIISLLPLIYSLLIMMRGNIVLIMLIYVFIYLNYKGGISFKKVISIMSLVIALLYIFGMVGNYRMISSGYGSDDAILRVGQATPAFYELNIPSEFFWSYIYITTPFSNLQYQASNITSNLEPFNAFKYHVMIDWLQKRTFDNPFQSQLLQDELNVSTMYGDVLQSSGYGGALIVFLWFSCVNILSIFLCNPRYRLVMISILSAISILCCFSNVITFSAYGMLPFYLVIFSWVRIGNFRFF